MDHNLNCQKKGRTMTERDFTKIMEECTSIDDNGKMTFLLGKILDKMDIPRTKKNMDYLSDTLEAIVRKHYPSVPIMHTVVKPSGISGESNDEQSLAQ